MKKILNFIKVYFISSFYIMLSSSFLLFSKRWREVIYSNYLFIQKNLLNKSIRANLPYISLSEVIGNGKITLLEAVSKTGNMGVGELTILNGILLKYRPEAIFEIGTFDGRTTLNMAMNTPDNCRIYTLNLPPDEEISTGFILDEGDKTLTDLRFESGYRFLKLNPSDFPEVKKINPLFGDSAKFDFSDYFGKIDFIFIDGAHNYDYVLNDTEIALKLLRNGKGIILWHDYRDDYEVVQAIDTLKMKYPELKFRRIIETDIAYVKID